MNNYQYFEYSRQNPEGLFDPYYTKNKVVIPKDSSIENDLTRNNKRLIDCITAFKVLISQGYTINDLPLINIVKEVVNILATTPNINYSAFSQFFMVYNSTYSFFKKLNNENRFKFIYEMLLKYCKERHDMYCSYGYSDSILQVMCDNYSHKRNGKTTIDKILSILSQYRLKRISHIDETDDINFYFLPDKGNRTLFEEFLKNMT